MQDVERGDGAEEGKVLQNAAVCCWNEQDLVFVFRACEWQRSQPHVPFLSLTRSLSCPGIYSDVVMLLRFVHVTSAFS